MSEANWQNIASELQQRIGQKVGEVTAKYEGELVLLRDEATRQIQALQQRVAELEANQKESDVPQEEPAATAGPAVEPEPATPAEDN